MKPDLLLDYDFALSSQRYVVRALLKLEGRAPEAANRRPLNLSLVLDRSGSMAGEKLAAARDAAAGLVRRLHPDDVASVVAFDDQVRTVAAPATGVRQADLPALISGIGSGGSTNLSGGWLRGRDLIAEERRDGGVNRVILLTDGMANVGITDPDSLTRLCGTAREEGITTTTIGFGADFEEQLLRAMADAGGGHTYYIERPDQAMGIFEEELEGLLSLCAQNVSVEIVPADAVELAAVHHAYPSNRSDTGLRLDVGDLYAREPRKVLVEFTVPSLVEEKEIAIAELRITAHVLTEEGGVERQELRLPIRATLTRAGMENPEVRREVLLAGTARAREEALRERERDDISAARRHLAGAVYALRADPSLAGDAEIREEIADLEGMTDRLAAGQFSAMDAKYMSQRSYDAGRSKRAAMGRYSRSAGPADGDPDSPASIRYVRGDATHPVGFGRKLILHVADTGGEWGAGFGRALSGRWPQSEAMYRAWAAGELPGAPPFALGELKEVEVGPEVWVAVLLAKEGSGAPGAPGAPPRLRYEALDRCLAGVAAEAARLGASVHMPRVATGAAGGQWNLIERMVEDRVCDAGVAVTVYGS